MNNYISITVPSTNKASRISKAAFQARLNSVLEVGSQLLGGATATKGVGSWYSEDLGATVVEDVYNVKMFGTSKSIKDNLTELASCLSFWRNDWNQEALAVEVNGSLYLIESDNDINNIKI